MNTALPVENFTVDIELLEDPIFAGRNLQVSMLRLDKIHPIISGNKIFKLHYFLEDAKKSSHKQVITFGGAYSNHLAATAFACKEAGLNCIGFVRGEEPKKLSHTLQFCIENKMHLEFMSRSSYEDINENKFRGELSKKYGEHILIPEGGFSTQGATGAALIYNYLNEENYTHICCPIGTATTFSGLIDKSKKATLMGFSVLKNLNDITERLTFLNKHLKKKYTIVKDYHFGGYAKKNNSLISFMNSFYDRNKIPLDFVYTAKMMYGVYDLINKNYFTSQSKILCIHTGGLQGNQSLPSGTLNF